LNLRFKRNFIRLTFCCKNCIINKNLIQYARFSYYLCDFILISTTFYLSTHRAFIHSSRRSLDSIGLSRLWTCLNFRDWTYLIHHSCRFYFPFTKSRSIDIANDINSCFHLFYTFCLIIIWSFTKEECKCTRLIINSLLKSCKILNYSRFNCYDISKCTTMYYTLHSINLLLFYCFIVIF